MSDATRGGTPDDEVRAAGLKVHGDKLDGLIPRDDAGGAPINSDHPDVTSEPGSGGLMPGSYEQAGGEAGRRADERQAAEAIRAPGSRVPDPNADPRLRREALDIAAGESHRGETPGAGPR